MGNAKSLDKVGEANVEGASSSSQRKPKIAIPTASLDKDTPKKKSKTGSARSSMSSQGSRRPLLTANQRSIVKYCMDNAKDDIGERIYRRAIDKRDDFRAFVDNLPRTQKMEMVEALKDFLHRICDNMLDADECQKMAEEFGARHVPFRLWGFKPDYFACTAEAVTTECSFLDAATHGASETAASWLEVLRIRRRFRSQLSGTLFSAVRDGYYAQLRRQRKSSAAAFRGGPKNSMDVSTDGSKDEDNSNSRRSTSPFTDGSEEGASLTEKEANNFLLPPTVY